MLLLFKNFYFYFRRTHVEITAFMLFLRHKFAHIFSSISLQGMEPSEFVEIRTTYCCFLFSLCGLSLLNEYNVQPTTVDTYRDFG